MLAFIPGYPPSPQRLLARFLPPLAEGVAAHYLERHTAPGELVLDPFGQSPQIALEALHLDRRVIVANFNPISRLALSLAVRPPTRDDLTAALARLAETRVQSQLLEDYLRDLYQTRCAQCERPISADTFEWDVERDSEAPVLKTYHCPEHGSQRGPVDDLDRALAGRFSRRGPDAHELLFRVAEGDDPDRADAQAALEVYPARALAAISAALRRYEGLKPDAETRRLLAGLLTAAFDAACPLAQERPRQLIAPKRFVEHNFWLALDNARALLAGVPAEDRSLPLPELLASSAGGYLHSHTGPVRPLANSLPAGACAAILTCVPRPNQAYWTLSALWSAWLAGKESGVTLRKVLRRRRYDWSWHAEALRRTIDTVRPALADGRPFIGLVPEAEPGFNAAVLSAADRAGYVLRGAALRADTAEAQFEWTHAGAPASAFSGPLLDVALKNTAREAALGTLRERGEPSRWATVHLGAWRALAEKRLLAAIADDPIVTVNRALDPVIHDPETFLRLGAEPDDEPATGTWWLARTGPADGEGAPEPDQAAPADAIWASGRPDEAAPPPEPMLADRVEAEVLRLLAAEEEVDEHRVFHAACAAFPGMQTPGAGLVQVCLTSYADQIRPGVWRLRAEDGSARRAEEVQSILAELRALGTRHDYQLAGANPLEWREPGQLTYLFAVISSAAVGSLAAEATGSARRRFLVLPGGRAGLLEFKLRRNPVLRALLREHNWLVVKFRQIRQMALSENLTRATLEPAFGADPLEEARQLALLDGAP